MDPALSVKLCDVQYVCASHIRTVQVFTIMTLVFKNSCIKSCIINLLIFRENPCDICGKNQKSVFCALCSIPESHHVCFSNGESFCEGHPVLFFSLVEKKDLKYAFPFIHILYYIYISCVTLVNQKQITLHITSSIWPVLQMWTQLNKSVDGSGDLDLEIGISFFAVLPPHNVYSVMF